MSDRTDLLRFFDVVFSDERRKAIYDFLALPGWETGWKSNSKIDPFTFLHKHFAGHRKDEERYSCEAELSTNAPIIYDAWIELKEKHFQNRTLIRCYANGMMYGMDGTVHVDASKPNNYTFVYYPHERWSANWGGETMFYNRDENSVVRCNYPRPNSAIMFDGRITHRANGVTRQFPGVRITLMFKFEVTETTS